MQQRLANRLGVEIAGFTPQHEIQDKANGSDDMLAELRVGLGPHDEPTHRGARREHEHQRWKNPFDAANVKFGEAELRFCQALEHDSGDEIAGDDEENVDADKAAPELTRPSVKADNDDNRYRAPAVNVGAISQSRRYGHQRRPNRLCAPG